MAEKTKKKSSPKNIKKQIKTEVIAKLTEALKEYKTPETDKKLIKEIEKTSKSIAQLVLKGKKETASVSEKKIA
jgi:hypothetical protein